MKFFRHCFHRDYSIFLMLTDELHLRLTHFLVLKRLLFLLALLYHFHLYLIVKILFSNLFFFEHRIFILFQIHSMIYDVFICISNLISPSFLFLNKQLWNYCPCIQLGLNIELPSLLLNACSFGSPQDYWNSFYNIIF